MELGVDRGKRGIHRGWRPGEMGQGVETGQAEGGGGGGDVAENRKK